MNHFSDVCQAPPPTLNQVEVVNTPPPGMPQAQANAVEISTAPAPQGVLYPRKVFTKVAEQINARINARAPLEIFGGGVDTNEVELDIRVCESLRLRDYLETLERIECNLSDPYGRSATVMALPDTGSNINLLPDDVARLFDHYRTVKLSEDMKPNAVN